MENLAPPIQERAPLHRTLMNKVGDFIRDVRAGWGLAKNNPVEDISYFKVDEDSLPENPTQGQELGIMAFRKMREMREFGHIVREAVRPSNWEDAYDENPRAVITAGAIIAGVVGTPLVGDILQFLKHINFDAQIAHAQDTLSPTPTLNVDALLATVNAESARQTVEAYTPTPEEWTATPTATEGDLGIVTPAETSTPVPTATEQPTDTPTVTPTPTMTASPTALPPTFTVTSPPTPDGPRILPEYYTNLADFKAILGQVVKKLGIIEQENFTFQEVAHETDGSVVDLSEISIDTLRFVGRYYARGNRELFDTQEDTADGDVGRFIEFLNTIINNDGLYDAPTGYEITIIPGLQGLMRLEVGTQSEIEQGLLAGSGTARIREFTDNGQATYEEGFNPNGDLPGDDLVRTADQWQHQEPEVMAVFDTGINEDGRVTTREVERYGDNSIRIVTPDGEEIIAQEEDIALVTLRIPRGGDQVEIRMLILKDKNGQRRAMFLIPKGVAAPPTAVPPTIVPLVPEAQTIPGPEQPFGGPPGGDNDTDDDNGGDKPERPDSNPPGDQSNQGAPQSLPPGDQSNPTAPQSEDPGDHGGDDDD